MFSMYKAGMLRHGRPTRLALQQATEEAPSSQDLACTIRCLRQEHAHRVWQAMQAVAFVAQAYNGGYEHAIEGHSAWGGMSVRWAW